MVVGAAHDIWLIVGQLAFDPIWGETHLIEPCAARGARGMRTELTRPTQGLQHLPKRCCHHRFSSVVPVGEEMGSVAGERV